MFIYIFNLQAQRTLYDLLFHHSIGLLIDFYQFKQALMIIIFLFLPYNGHISKHWRCF